MIPINQSGEIWSLIVGTTQFTGSLYLTFVLTLIFFIFLLLMFRVPLWAALLFCIPFVVTVMAFDSSFIVPGGLMLLVLGLIFALNFWLYK